MAKREVIEIKGLETTTVKIKIRSISPLLQHRFANKEAIGGTKIGEEVKSRKKRDRRDVEKECADAAHSLGDDRYGIPVMAFKGALISAAHKDIGIEKTLIRTNMFLKSSGRDPRCGTELIEIKTSGYRVDERVTRLPNGSPDKRYRPIFDQWEATLEIVYVNDRLSASNIATLVQRAGFTCGVGELRAEKCGGDYGRWEIVEG